MNLFVAFRLKPGRDDALINWLESLSDQDRSYHIREALRSNLQGPAQVSLGPFHASSKPEVISIPPQDAGHAKDVEAALDDWLNV